MTAGRTNPSTPPASRRCSAAADARRPRSVIVRGAATKVTPPPSRRHDLDDEADRRRSITSPAISSRRCPAGVSLDAVNDGPRAASGQWLPLDPPRSHRATIGGIVATNDSGPRRHRYGAPRDLIIGIEIALVDGRIAESRRPRREERRRLRSVEADVRIVRHAGRHHERDVQAVADRAVLADGRRDGRATSASLSDLALRHRAPRR